MKINHIPHQTDLFIVQRWNTVKMGELWRRHIIRAPNWALEPIASFLAESPVRGLHWDEDPITSTISITFYTPLESSPGPLLEKLFSQISSFELATGLDLDVDLSHAGTIKGDWATQWIRYFRKRRVTDLFTVVPPWDESGPSHSGFLLIIKPGRAFGIGIHESTVLCLRWIERLIMSIRNGRRAKALDLGTGSGILAIAMAKLGAREVWALDVDPDAVEEATHNARLNGVGGKIRFVLGSLEQVEGMRFDLVVANLTDRIIRSLAFQLVSSLTDGGRVVVSGFLAQELPHVREALEGAGLRALGSIDEGEWTSLMFKRKDFRDASLLDS
jgi:ribosomal protein L11 methyltransferase